MKQLIIAIGLFLIAFSSAGQIVDSKQDETSGLYGLVDKNGKWVVKPEYDFVYFPETGSPDAPITVQKTINSKEVWGVVDRKGKLLIPCKNEQVYIWDPAFSPLPSYYPYYTKAISVENHDDEYNSIESLYRWDGTRLIKNDYEQIAERTPSNPTYRVEKNDKYGLYSSKGKQLLDCIYDEMEFSDRYVIPVKDGKAGLYDPASAKFVLTLQFDTVKFSGIDDIFIVSDRGKYGIYGTKGQIIPCMYSDISNFQDDVATAVLDGKAVLIKNPLLSDGEIQFADLSQGKKASANGRAVSRYPAPNSDVDKNIPEKKDGTAENKFAFIIANENYPDAPVPYALNDGRMFAEYCQKSLGIPSSNIRLTEDATYAKIIAEIDQIKAISDAYGEDASIILYYAGHGIPDEQQNSAYMFPVDGQLRNVSGTAYSLENLYKELSLLPVKETIVLIDACFSGANRENEMLLTGRGVAIKAKEEKPGGNVVAFSASTGNETAHQLSEKTHGLFTYYLLKAMQENNGNITLGELTDYVTKNVKRQSVVMNSKKQTPTVIPSPNKADNWRDVRL